MKEHDEFIENIIKEMRAGKQKANVPANSDMANYQFVNTEYFDDMHVTRVSKTENGYDISLADIGKQTGLSGLVPAELGFEPKEGMLAVWDGMRKVGANVNLSFYDTEGKSLFEMRREGVSDWREVRRTPKVNIPENSYMANYQHKNVEEITRLMVTKASKTDDGYNIKLSELGKEDSGLTGFVPAELGFEPQKGMLAVWDGARYVGANVNLSFYDAEGKNLFEMQRHGTGKWRNVTGKENPANTLARMRQKLAQKIDDKLGTNLTDVELPKSAKKIEAWMSKSFDNER